MKKILCLALLIWACSSKQGPLKNAENERQYKLVMDLHDSVMVKTNKDIAQEQNRLRKLLPQVQDSLGKRQLLDALKLLGKAHDDMMQWMADFKGIEMDSAHYAPMTEAQIKAYLKAEEEKIAQVGVLTDSALGLSRQIKGQ
jgi:hypothetical protein